MAEEVPPGALMHVEFYTDTPEETKRFYRDAFGWDFRERPGTGYTEIDQPGGVTAGLLARRDGAFQPPAVYAYLRADDTDAACLRIERAGGKVLRRYEVPGVGRFAVFEAPGGIVQGLWGP